MYKKYQEKKKETSEAMKNKHSRQPKFIHKNVLINETEKENDNKD